jgi:hypothetical protein
MKLTLICLALLTALCLAQMAVSGRFRESIAALKEAAVAEQRSSAAAASEPLPDIVRRFAERNGGRRGAATVLLRQRVQMRLGPDSAFFDVDATHLAGTRVPAFVWEATATMAMVVPIRVVDSYVGGQGLLEVRAAGFLQMAHATGPESDLGEMMRFLAELAWNPDAILNATALAWRQIDDRTAEVSAPTAGGIARVRQIFDAQGDIVGIEANDRPYLVDGQSRPTRWIGRFSDYTQFGAYRIPRNGEIAWDLPEGEYVYWRGTITSFSATP